VVVGLVRSLADHPLRLGDKLWGLPVSALWGGVLPLPVEGAVSVGPAS